jgi:cytochrome c oxidase subunit II
VASLLLAPMAFGDALTPESGGSPNANQIDSLYKLILVLATIVFIGVEGTLLYSLIRFRARRGRVAAQIHGNTGLEIGWTVGAAVILVFLTVFTFIKLNGIKDPPASDPGGLNTANGAQFASIDQPNPPSGKYLRIAVNGQQFVWRYTYPDKDANPLNNVYSYELMVVPVHTTVVLDIESQDVAHSWWIPKLGGKFDAVPGYVNHTWFKISKPGVYYGQCAELCGRSHADMIARVKAVPVAEYQAWLEGQKAGIDAARKLAAADRQKFEPKSTAPGGSAPQARQ